VEKLDLKIEDLSSPEYTAILDRATNRLEKALVDGAVDDQWINDEIEILSFPIAVMMAVATTDTHFKRRYALAETKRVYNILKEEREGKVIEVAKKFSWRIKPAELNGASAHERSYDYSLHFVDFLKNISGFREKKWKLANRFVQDGYVYLSGYEAARLLAEEVRKHIEKKLDAKGVLTPPQNIAERIDRFKRAFAKQRGMMRFEEIPKSVITDAFPPCMRQLHDEIASGRHISHISRFALTSFLVSIGMTVENVIDLFRSSSDFNERVARYQVAHIAGEKGSRTKYTPPRCDTLQTHGICPGPNEICRTVRHPLAYYRRKARGMKEKAAYSEREEDRYPLVH